MTPPSSGGSLLLACILALLAMFLPLTIDGSLPLIPAIAQHFGSSPSAAQFCLSAAVLGIASGQLVYGPLSDRFGRKPVILAGVFCFILSSVASMMVQTIESLIAIRFLQGCFACTGIIVARAVIRDLYNRETGAQVFALMMSLHGIMPAIAPGICGWLGQALGWQAVFLSMAVFGGCAFVAVLLGLGESNLRADPEAARPMTMLRNYRQILGNATFRAHVACACFVYGGLFSYFAGAPIGIIQYLQLQPSDYGVAMALPMLTYIVTQLVVSRFIIRLGLARTLRTGIILLVVSGAGAFSLIVADSVTLYRFIACIILLLMAQAFITPVTTSCAVSPFPHSAGAASSLLGFLQFLAATVVTAAIGLFSDGTPLPMASAMLVCGLGAAAVWLGMVRPMMRTVAPP